ncbi:MAG: radical SAM protein, partial [Candidatus Omnitrophica bacterium]|nr:radical SAM protein [Candidatus Omnitrophota bacterium]
MHENFIQEITIEITNQCNLRCKVCNIWQEKHRVIPLTGIHQFIKSVATQYKIGSISITGGEPFLHPQIGKILQLMYLLRKKGSIRCFDINTNGYATKKILQTLKENREFLEGCHVGISLDGINEKHSEIRGRSNAFKKTFETIKGIKILFGDSLKLRVKFTISKFNYDEVYPFYLFCLENNLMFSPKISEQNVGNYYHRLASTLEFSPLLQSSIRESIKQQLEKIFIEEKKKTAPIIDFAPFSLLIDLVSHDNFPIKSCQTPLKCLFITSEQKVFCCLNMEEIGTLQDGVSILFAEKHKKQVA